MVAVADLERFLERVFERTSARLFRSRIQAVQVERRVERAMEAGRTGRGAATTVPSRFRVRLHPADLDDLARRSGGFDALALRLADRALAFARLHAYHMAARPVVSVIADPSVELGRVEVDASDEIARPLPESAARSTAEEPPYAAAVPAATAPPAPGTGLLVASEVSGHMRPPAARPPDDVSFAPSPAPVEPLGANQPLPSGAPAVVPPAVPFAMTQDPDIAAPPFAPAAPASAPSAAPAHGLRTGDRPYAVRPVPPPPSRALLRVVEPGGREREVRVEGQALTLGRAPDNGLVIADARISRHHGRFQDRHGTLVYTDLGSTNGTRVNGIRVDEIVLGPGDRLQVGDVVLVVEQLPR